MGSRNTSVVAAARELGPLVREHADETERGRRLATPVVDALRARGLLAMGTPAALGGLETPLGDALRAIEELSYADGATGWNVMIAFDLGVWGGFLGAPNARKLIASIPRAIIAGSVSPPGQLRRVEGGFRLTGRWHFGSGCQQADVFIVGAICHEAGAFVAGPNGLPELYGVAVRPADIKILDTWRVTGMRGTGSHDYMIEDAFIGEGFAAPMGFDRSPVETGALYRCPMLVTYAFAKAAIAIGIARHAIEALKDLAQSKKAVFSAHPIRERIAIQTDVARAEAIARSASAFLYQTVDQVWQCLASGEAVSHEQRAVAHLAAVDAVHRCTQAVDLMFTAGGATAIHESSPLERCFRDAHIVGAHVTVQPAMYEAAGRVLLGLPPGTGVW
ncbi:MAG TPA: acyl-CoA dehydrogenase family protein [Candidatus Binataceae bacterium]|nr:acyl-CoA dehydrogenase family protein [Candidatus Binataceae bacterium]